MDYLIFEEDGERDDEGLGIKIT